MKKRNFYRSAFILFSVLILLNTLSCSVEIFNDFSVISVNIRENEVIGTDKQALEIVFSKEVDQKSAESSTRIETDSFTQVSFTIEVVENRLRLLPETDWEPYERYWLIISGEIQDTYGKKMGEDFYLPFQSTEEIFPVSAVLLQPVIIDGVVSEETDNLQIGFSGAVDRNSVEREFLLSPDVEGSFEWTSDRSFIYHLEESFEKNCFYSIQISGNARDLEGNAIKSFLRELEYYPNQPVPVIDAVYAGSDEIFNRDDSTSYRIEKGRFIIEYDEAEKDLVLRIDFSREIDRRTFKESFRITPLADWHEIWIDDDIVEICFDENLIINERYELSLDNTVEDRDGLNLSHNYMITMWVNGEGSRFLDFYAIDFTDVILEEPELWLNNAMIVNGVDGIVIETAEENNWEGHAVKIDYNENAVQQSDVPNLEIRWEYNLSFSNPSYVPVLEQSSLQDSILIELVFGNSSYSGDIFSFTWTHTNECKVDIREIGSGNIYRFTIQGGSAGVVDNRNNYIENDIEYNFKVKLVPD